MKFCGVCGAHRPSLAQEKLIDDLEVTLRQLERLHAAGALDEINLRALKAKLETERELILFPQGRPGTERQPSPFTPGAKAPPVTASPIAPRRCRKTRAETAIHNSRYFY